MRNQPNLSRVKNWRTLIEAGKAFDRLEQSSAGASAYDDALRDLDRSQLPKREEVEKIFRFVNRWGSRVRRANFPEFCERYTEIWPYLSRLSELKIEEVSLRNTIPVGQERVRIDLLAHYCFDTLRHVWKVGPTPASKALHISAPGLLIMWDESIRWDVASGESGFHYAYKYLPSAKMDIELALNSYMAEKNCSHEDATASIIAAREDRNYTLAKMIDEFYWVTMTKGRKID